MFFLGIAALSSVAQSGIQVIQAAFDPSSASPQNVKLTVFTNVVGPPSAIALQLSAVSPTGVPTPIPSPAAQAVPGNPTAAFFLVPISTLTGAEYLSYKATLSVNGNSQISSESQMSLEPLASIQQITSQAASLTATVGSLTSQVNTYQQAVKNSLPDAPAFVAQRFRGNAVMVQFTTDRAGILDAQIRKTDDSLIEDHKESVASLTHTFTFSNVLPGTPYYLVAAVLDPVTLQDVAGTTLSGKGDNRLQGQTKSPPSPPAISDYSASETNSTSFKFSFKLDHPSVYQITCYHVPDPGTPSIRDTASVPVPEKKDSFGITSGDYVSGVQNGSCTGLEPEQWYTAEITATDEFGQPVSSPADIMLQLPKALNFDGAIQVTFSAKGMTFAWKATTKNAIGAFEIALPGMPPASQAIPSSGDGTSFTTTINVNSLATGYGIDPTKAQSTLPTFTASLTDSTGKEHASVSFSASATIPSSSAAVTGIATSPSNAASLNAVVSGIQNPTNNKKFSWQDLLQTGIGALIKLVP
jgi:hypothetical protein